MVHILMAMWCNKRWGEKEAVRIGDNVLTSGLGRMLGLLALYKVVTSLNKASKRYTFFFTGEHLQT